MRLVTCMVLLCASLPAPAAAQGTPGSYSISGMVTDPSGAGIPNAAIRVRLRGTTAATADSRTDNLGNFHIPSVPAGSLEIEVNGEGFASRTIRLTVKDSAPAPLHIELQLAGVHRAVTVSDSVAQVSTDSADNLDTVTVDRQMITVLDAEVLSKPEELR